jgi:hypothetical protein
VVVPSPGITGEIVTPYGISDWNSIVRARGNWELLGEVKAPKGAVSVYRNQIPVEHRNFSSATEWIKNCAKARGKRLSSDWIRIFPFWQNHFLNHEKTPNFTKNGSGNKGRPRRALNEISFTE